MFRVSIACLSTDARLFYNDYSRIRLSVDRNVSYLGRLFARLFSHDESERMLSLISHIEHKDNVSLTLEQLCERLCAFRLTSN